MTSRNVRFPVEATVRSRNAGAAARRAQAIALHDRERRERLGERHALAKRQHRERLGQLVGDGDLLGADPREAARAASQQALAAWLDVPLDRPVHLSTGDFPASEYGWQLFGEHLIQMVAEDLFGLTAVEIGRRLFRASQGLEHLPVERASDE